jgi:hypothetical protein
MHTFPFEKPPFKPLCAHIPRIFATLLLSKGGMFNPTIYILKRAVGILYIYKS